jgi:hypothetical protein
MGEPLRITLEPNPQLLSADFAQGGQILGEKLHFLGHPALHNSVPLVQTHRKRLAVKNLLPDSALQQSGKFLLGRRATDSK